MTSWFLNNFIPATRGIHAAPTNTITAVQAMSAVHQTKAAVYVETRAARVKTDRSSNQLAVLPAQQNKLS